MDERASGESKLRGSKAVKLVLTVAGTLIAARFVRATATARPFHSRERHIGLRDATYCAVLAPAHRERTSSAPGSPPPISPQALASHAPHPC